MLSFIYFVFSVCWFPFFLTYIIDAFLVKGRHKKISKVGNVKPSELECLRNSYQKVAIIGKKRNMTKIKKEQNLALMDCRFLFLSE